MATQSRKGKKSSRSAGLKRRERRFSTSVAFVPIWVTVVGMVGCLILGTGVFGLWIQDPPLGFASYLVALGGLGLGIAIWFGQPAESAVSIGDSGVAVENGRESLRVPWFDLRSLHVTGGHVVVEGTTFKLKFSLGANRHATARLLKESALRVPDVVNVNTQITESLPSPDDVKGYLQDVEDDQVTGMHCAASDRAINMEDDARLCPRCGQVFHKDTLPDKCTSCDEHLEGKTLRA